MAIEGLIKVESEQRPYIDIHDDAHVTLEALNILGVVDDKEAALASITADYASLLATEVNETGELYVDIPYTTLSTQGMINAIDAHGKRIYPKTSVDTNLWTPGAKNGSYSDEELAISSGNKPTAQLALHGRDEEPLLHFLHMPFDYNTKLIIESRTQLEAIAEAKTAFESIYPELTMKALGHRAFLMIALQHRIKGESVPLTDGHMRDASLPRTNQGRISVVAEVNSERTQLCLNSSRGYADPYRGVGLSVSQKEGKA